MITRSCLFPLAVAAALVGCESLDISTIEKSALSDELKNETTAPDRLPPSCPTLSLTLPPGQSTISVSYQEPELTAGGRPITDLAYTTIYVVEPQQPPRSIRVWTNNPRGGAQVQIREIPVSGRAVGLCVTATNWARIQSSPGQIGSHKK